MNPDGMTIGKTDENKLLIILDASAFGESSCLLRLFYNTVLGLRAKLNSNDIEFGTAFHKFRAHYRQYGRDGQLKAIKLARDYYRETPMVVKSNKKYLTDQFLMTTCLDYMETYDKDTFDIVKTDKDEHLLELKFCPPHLIYSDSVMELMLAGTIDEIGKFRSGVYSITDCKTSSIWDIKSYFEGYLLSPQLMFYRWILREYAIEFPESIFAKINNEGCGVFIDGVFYSGADKPVKFERSSVWMFRDETLDEFGLLVALKTKELIDVVHRYIYEHLIPIRYGMLNGSCNTKYGQCKYFSVCSALDDDVRGMVIERNFIKQQYNPLTFQE